MDAAAAGEKRRSGRGHVGSDTPSRGQGNGRGRGGQGRAASQKLLQAQAAIVRGLNAKLPQANVLESRITSTDSALQIDGLSSSKAASNPDGGVESLLAFLERKASAHDPKSKPVKIKKSLKKGGSVIITASPDDVLAIQKLNGYSFAGADLSITACEPPSSRLEKPKDEVSVSAQETKERLRGVLASRYDANLKLLNLAALAQDPGLIQMGVFDGSTTTSKIFPALMVVCDGLFKTRSEKREAIVSVTLADNDLVDVKDVAALAQTFPDIKNLDLSRNKIAQLSSLDAWGTRFRDLVTLILTGNPIEPSLPAIKSDLVKKYPHLEILNGVQFRTPEEIASTIEATKYPIPLQTPDFRDVGQVGENFIRQFVALYDSNRSALLTNFYDDESVLSLAINMAAPRNPKQILPIAPWAPYLKYSRNLVRVNNLPTQMSRLHRGSQAINTVWSALPATRHPDLQTQPEKYLIECHSLPGLVDPNGQSARGVDGLIITMHGEFEEENDKPEQALRSFSRTFVLGPGGPGGPAIRVISDMMTLRAWGPLALPRVAAVGGVPLEAAPAVTEQQQQEAFAQQLVLRTGLTLQYAILCLTETGWDLEKAFVAFEANRNYNNMGI
ncbi:putative mRNA export factor MEX67 [Glarea lozoyensis 74030]|uniref:mRNA export factor MEX67 n=1 Tax=Glarea lozoyensis (strain ATCC 74030 / MF5533) TaxID=1104152 RepID=H0ECY2_GLAL7|nr:putative mRNA export factor MEX67 [Glarea lozoyensis 74030]